MTWRPRVTLLSIFVILNFIPPFLGVMNYIIVSEFEREIHVTNGYHFQNYCSSFTIDAGTP
jgi:hypothetical protein